MSNETRRINIDMDRELWHQVGIESAKLGITKKDFTISALKEKIKELNEDRGETNG